MGLRLVHLAGAALTFVVAAGFTCIDQGGNGPTYVPPNDPPPTTDGDAGAVTPNSRQAEACSESNPCTGRTTCLGERCTPCGAAGQLPCGGENVAACDQGTQANTLTSTCEHCGEAGQHCCDDPDGPVCREGMPPLNCGSDSDGGYYCSLCSADAGMCERRAHPPDGGVVMGHIRLCGPGFVASDAGVCVQCGARAGMPCCRDGACLFPLACSDRGVCAAHSCGGLRQPCCRGDRCVIGRCNAGTCTR